MFNPFDLYTIPLREWVAAAIDWLTTNYRDFFQTIKLPVELVLEWTEDFLLWLHPLAFLALLLFIAWRIARLAGGGLQCHCSGLPGLSGGVGRHYDHPWQW